MASRKLPDVFENFDIPDNLDGNFKAKCKYCQREISGLIATTNFIKNMKRNHPIKYEKFKSFKEPKGDNQLKLNLLSTSITKYPLMIHINMKLLMNL